MNNSIFSEKRMIYKRGAESLSAPSKPEAPSGGSKGLDALALEKQAHEIVDRIARLRTAIIEAHPKIENPSSKASKKVIETYRKLTALQKQMEEGIKGTLDKANGGLSKIITETLKSLDDTTSRLPKKHPVRIARNKYLTGLMKQIRHRQSLKGTDLVGLMSSLRPGESMVTIFQKNGKVTGGGAKNIKRAIDYGGLIVVVKRIKAKKGDKLGDKLKITYIDRGYNKKGAYEKKESLVATFGIGKKGWEVRDHKGVPFSTTTKGALAYMDLLYNENADDKMDLVVRDGEVPIHRGPKLSTKIKRPKAKPRAATLKELAKGGSVGVPAASPGKDIKVFKRKASKEDTTVTGTPPVSAETDRLLAKAANMDGYFASKPGETRIMPTLPGTDTPSTGGAQPLAEEIVTVFKKGKIGLKEGAEEYVSEYTMDANGIPTKVKLAGVSKKKIHDIVGKPSDKNAKIAVTTKGETHYAKYERGTFREKGGKRVRIYNDSVVNLNANA